MPAQGISLHIGLNSVDPKRYDGWDGALVACEFDAKDMKALATKRGFAATTLMTRKATAAAVKAEIEAAAKKLGAGDFFFLTYSGHGSQVPDRNADEPDKQDETWVLYDRQLVDDELFALWGKFKAGVRILVLSDSCHSGSVTRAMPEPGRAAGRARLMPPARAAAEFRAHAAEYDALLKAVPTGDKVSVKAAVVLISGCQDNQTSLDGDRNGLFTETLKKVWQNGKFAGNYRRFRDTIAQRMPATQTPNYFVAGKKNAVFEGQVPFAL